jgi:hypothetical protein
MIMRNVSREIENLDNEFGWYCGSSEVYWCDIGEFDKR